MNTLKSIGLSLMLLIVCAGAKAATGSLHNYQNKEQVINTYLNAIVHGKLDELDNAIDDDASFNMIRGQNVNTLSKNQLLSSLKSAENIEQDCKCSTTVVQDSDDTIIRKVEMKYSDFTRTDIITAQRAGSGWKITKVDTSFK